MSSVDDRIVNMQFNNKQFTQGAEQTKRDLDSIEKALGNTAKSKGLTQMASDVDQVSGRFSAMKIAGISAIATVASKATAAGLSLLKSFTIDPILDGFREYSLNLNSIQTIMANTGKEVDVVNDYLDQLNTYSDQTIYNFGQMADSIGKFTAAGVKLPAATVAIKGMANSAALGGASVQQLNTAMYQTSQALSTGVIKLMDWNSLVNAQLGGKNMQKTLVATAHTMGDLGDRADAAKTKYGSFRESLRDGWLEAPVFTKAMKVMAGVTLDTGKGAKSAAEQLKDMGYSAKEVEKYLKSGQKTVAYSVKQLKEMGYSEEAAKELNKLSNAAINSATKIKTFSQLMDVVKESVGSGFAGVFKKLFGNFNEASRLWTNVGNVIQGKIDAVFGSFENLLVGWKSAGGYKALWEGFGNIFQTLGNLIKPFVAAFQALFPKSGKTGKALGDLTKGFASFTGWLEKLSRNADKLTPILTTIFGSFKKIGQVVGPVKDAFAALSPIFAKIGSTVGDFAAKGAKMAEELIAGLVEGLDVGALKDKIYELGNSVIEWVKGVFGIASPAATMIPLGWAIAQGLAQGIIEGAKYIGVAIAQLFAALIQGIPKLFAGFDALDWTALFNSIMSGALLVLVYKMAKVADQFIGWMNNIQNIFDGVGDSLKAWQKSLKAKMILQIAIAIGILAVALFILSKIDPVGLAQGLFGIGVMLFFLSKSMKALSDIESDKSMLTVAASILLVGIALIAMATAVSILGRLSLEQIMIGIGGLAFALGMMVAAMLALAKWGGPIEGAAAAIVAVAVAMVILSKAIELLGRMDPDTLQQGLAGLAYAMGILTISIAAIGALGGPIKGAAATVLLMAVAITILVGVIKTLGSMDVDTLQQGLDSLAWVLLMLTASLVALGAAGPATAAGGAGVLLVAFALSVLVPVIFALGSMPWQVLVVGLLAMAYALTILVAAGAVAMYVAPGLYALATALLAFGAAVFLVGAGMALFATGFALMAATGVAGIAVMSAAIEAFIMLLPTIAQQMAAAFVAFIKVIANASGEIRKAFGEIFRNILGVITDNIPAIERTLTKLIRAAIRVIRNTVSAWIEAGIYIIGRFIEAVAKEVPKIAESGIEMLTEFMRAVRKGYPELADEAAKMIVAFVEGTADAIDNNVDDMRRAALKLAHALINGMTGGLLDEGYGAIRDAVSTLTGWIPGWIKKRLGIASPSKVTYKLGQYVALGFAKGIADSASEAVKAAIQMADAVISAGRKSVEKAQKAYRKEQDKANAAQARADIAAEKAAAARKYAAQHKQDKAAKKRANQLTKLAEKEQNKADKVQKGADKAADRVQAAQTFADADLEGKGDIKTAQALVSAERASRLLARANAEAAEARKVMKTNKKLGQKMLKEAEKTAKAAKEAAKKAQEQREAALAYYQQAVEDRIKAYEDERAAEEKATADQKELDSADAAGKVAILTSRAEENEKKAQEAKEKAAALIAEAKKVAATDAKKAQELLDQAEEETKKAKEAADQAASERQQIEQLRGGSGGSGSSASPSKTALEDAAKAVDRYTESLRQAEELAAASTTTVQFNQNNYSPEALSPAEVYRQTKNLVAATEIKMGADT